MCIRDNPHSEQARSSGAIAALAGLHQHHRKYDGDRASRHPQCEALEFVLDGFALDRCGHERSQERLSQSQILQATSGIAARACRSLRKGNEQSRSCPNCEGRLTSFTATTASQSSTKHGAIPRFKVNALSSGRLAFPEKAGRGEK